MFMYYVWIYLTRIIVYIQNCDHITRMTAPDDTQKLKDLHQHHRIYRVPQTIPIHPSINSTVHKKSVFNRVLSYFQKQVNALYGSQINQSNATFQFKWGRFWSVLVWINGRAMHNIRRTTTPYCSLFRRASARKLTLWFGNLMIHTYHNVLCRQVIKVVNTKCGETFSLIGSCNTCRPCFNKCRSFWLLLSFFFARSSALTRRSSSFIYRLTSHKSQIVSVFVWVCQMMSFSLFTLHPNHNVTRTDTFFVCTSRIS